MLKIWGCCNFSNVCKVLWCVEEIGVLYELIEVGGVFGGIQLLEYCVMNFNGLVLVIEDYGLLLWEFNIIVCYLVVCYLFGMLYLEDVVECVQLEKWMDWIIFIFFGVFCDLFWGMLCIVLVDCDDVCIVVVLVCLGELLVMVDDVLLCQFWLFGECFVMGDILLGVFVYVWFEMFIQCFVLLYLVDWYECLKQWFVYQCGVMMVLI